MKMINVSIIMLVTVVASVTCNAQPKENVSLNEAKKAIAKSNALYHQSLVKNDPSIFINSYTEDACLLAPNSPMVCGREALASFFKEGYVMGLRGGKFSTANVYGDGKEYVTEEGTGQVWDANGKLIDDVKYLVLWKKTKQGWKMYRDSFSSNLNIKQIEKETQN
jgi:ketosteroid isomerase-like protein